MKQTEKWAKNEVKLADIAQVVNLCGLCECRAATKYVSPDMVVKATERFKPNGRTLHREFIVSVGKPNHSERQFIKNCQIVGEPFPVRKTQLKQWK